MNRRQYIAELLRERLSYISSGQRERVKDIDQELKRAGYELPDSKEVRETDPHKLPPQGRHSGRSREEG